MLHAEIYIFLLSFFYLIAVTKKVHLGEGICDGILKCVNERCAAVGCESRAGSVGTLTVPSLHLRSEVLHVSFCHVSVFILD